MSIQIQGTLLNPSGGNPAAGAQIRFISLAGWSGVPKGAESIEVTGADGSYDFQLQQGRYAVAINQNGVFAKQGSAVVNDETPSPLTIDELMEFSEPLTPGEIRYVEELVAQAELARDKSQQYANEASQSVVDASYEVDKAAQQVSYAEDQVDLAKAEVVNASNEADRAKSEADRASEVTGLDTVEEAVDMALSEFAGVMTASEHDAILAQNEEKYSASGFIQTGKHKKAGTAINEGMYLEPTIPNTLGIGRLRASDTAGTSKTDFAVSHIAGVVTNLIGASEYSNDNGLYIKLPPAPDGTVTFNSSTGANVTHADVATAFAAAAADPDVEVVTDRVDVTGLEQFEMVGDEIFDMVQSQSATFGDTDVPTVDSTLSDSFFAAYDGQTGIVKGKCVKWSALTGVQKRKVAAYMKERLWLDTDGNVKFTTIVQDSKRGLGNGDWFNINSANGALEFKSGDPVLSRAGFAFVKDENRQGVFTDNNGSYYYVLGAVSRLNTGAKAKGVNESGGMAFSDGNKWSSTVDSYATQLECFQNAHATLSGRDDGRLPQYIYEGGLGGVVDRRLSAYDMSSPEESAKVWEKVKNGTYRGLEKLVWTSLDKQLSSSSSSNPAVVVADASIYSVGDVVFVEYPLGVYRKTKVVTASPSTNTISFSEGGRLLDGHIVHERDLNISVSGNFTMTDVIGDPANILLTDALKNGWQGSWIQNLPDGASKTYSLTRKAMISQASFALTADNGASWTTGSGGYTDTTKNETPTYVLTASNIMLYTYTAFAKQTKPSANKPVLNGEAGVGSVFAGSNADLNRGVLLAESTIGKILKSGGDGRRLLKLNSVGLTDSGSLTNNLRDGECLHEALSLGAPSNSSHAVKALPYQISDSGQCSIGVQANELTWAALPVIDTSGSANTGKVVGNIYRVTDGVHSGRRFVCVRAGSVAFNSNDWALDSKGNLRFSDGVVYFVLDNPSSGWGDDSTMKITTDGSDTFVDLNGNTNLSVDHELALQHGWTHNHARVGTQVEGVDL